MPSFEAACCPSLRLISAVVAGEARRAYAGPVRGSTQCLDTANDHMLSEKTFDG